MVLLSVRGLLATVTQHQIILISSAHIRRRAFSRIMDATIIPQTRSGLRSGSSCKPKDIYEGEMVTKITKPRTKSTSTRTPKQKPSVSQRNTSQLSAPSQKAAPSKLKKSQNTSKSNDAAATIMATVATSSQAQAHSQITVNVSPLVRGIPIL